MSNCVIYTPLPPHQVLVIKLENTSVMRSEEAVLMFPFDAQNNVKYDL